MNERDNRFNLPVFPQRPVYEWINRVSRKRQEFEAIRLSADQRELIRRWTETEVARTALVLDPGSQPEEEWIRASSVVREIASGGKSELSPDLLKRIYNPSSEKAAEFRQDPGSKIGPAIPMAADQVPVAVEFACRWFAAESFSELHPVEQTAIALLRLLDIQPFSTHNQGTAWLAASFFALRAGLPPPILEADQAGPYLAAVGEGLRMSTQPMVELIADAIRQAFDGMMTLLRR